MPPFGQIWGRSIQRWDARRAEAELRAACALMCAPTVLGKDTADTQNVCDVKKGVELGTWTSAGWPEDTALDNISPTTCG